MNKPSKEVIKLGLREELGTELNHVAIVVRSIKEALPRLRDLGWKGGDYISEQPQNGRNLTALTRAKCAVKLEVLEPSGERSYLNRFLEDFGPFRQHHLTFDVSRDLVEVRQILLTRNFGLHEDKKHEVIIHPKGGGGTMVQFFPVDRPWMRSDRGGKEAVSSQNARGR